MPAAGKARGIAAPCLRTIQQIRRMNAIRTKDTEMSCPTRTIHPLTRHLKKAGSGRAMLCVAGALWLAGCGQAPLEMEQVSNELAQRLVHGADGGSGDEIAPVNIGGGLVSAVRASVLRHDGYRAALALERDAMARAGIAESARRPQVNATANVGAAGDLGSASALSTGAIAGVTVSQLVFDGGESAARVNRSTAEALAAQAERTLRSNELALEAASTWIDVWQFDQRLRLLRMRSEEMETLVTQIERMATNGMLDRAALDSARRQIIDITLEDTRLSSSLAEARVRFGRMFGAAPNRLERPAEIVSLPQARAQARAWREAPALLRAAAQAHAARSAVDEAQAAFSPRASLQAALRGPTGTGSGADANVGLSLQYTLGDGARRQSQLESAQARAEAVDAQLTDAQSTLEAEIAGILARLTAIEESMPLIVQKIRLSESESRIARSQIVTGQSNLRQLIEAEIENYRARDQQIAMQAEQWKLQLTIAARTGALARQLQLDTEPVR
jgi:outer membrane protein, adhesin transport system